MISQLFNIEVVYAVPVVPTSNMFTSVYENSLDESINVWFGYINHHLSRLTRYAMSRKNAIFEAAQTTVWVYFIGNKFMKRFLM